VRAELTLEGFLRADLAETTIGGRGKAAAPFVSRQGRVGRKRCPGGRRNKPGDAALGEPAQGRKHFCLHGNQAFEIEDSPQRIVLPEEETQTCADPPDQDCNPPELQTDDGQAVIELDQANGRRMVQGLVKLEVQTRKVRRRRQDADLPDQGLAVKTADLCVEVDQTI